MRNKNLIITLFAIFSTLIQCIARSIPPPPGLPPKKLPIDGGVPVFIAIAIVMGIYFIAKKRKNFKKYCN